jgi:TM2 domain-containing membrane protein YozV
LSRDLRKYAQQTNLRLIAGGLVLVFVVGVGLIYFFYGPAAALTGLLCLIIGLIPLILIWLMLWLIERFTKRE